MISAVTATGSFKYDIIAGTLDANKFIDFCGKLLAVHRSTAVKEYVARTDGRRRLFRLPSYSPELNSNEWVWKNVPGGDPISPT